MSLTTFLFFSFPTDHPLSTTNRHKRQCVPTSANDAVGTNERKRAQTSANERQRAQKSAAGANNANERQRAPTSANERQRAPKKDRSPRRTELPCATQRTTSTNEHQRAPTRYFGATATRVTTLPSDDYALPAVPVALAPDSWRAKLETGSYGLEPRPRRAQRQVPTRGHSWFSALLFRPHWSLVLQTVGGPGLRPAAMDEAAAETSTAASPDTRAFMVFSSGLPAALESCT